MSLQQLDNADFEGGQGDAQSCSGTTSRSSDASSSSNTSRVGSAQASPGGSPKSYSQDDFEDDKDASSVLEKPYLLPVKKSPRKAKGYHHKGNEAFMVK